ncbi:MAG: phospholipid carrier-dependent glycosyltransferase, partial [Sphingobacteriaceae bacterium]
VGLMLLLIFLQGIIYPPNNWDSMTYHMGRIASWVGNHSVSFYPTHIIRQLYQPPFAEYAIMHIDLLHRNDHFSNTVQFFFFLGTIVTITSITQQLGLGRAYQSIAAILAATLPEALLQASGTQNDVVVSFFIVTACYFAVRAVKRNQLTYYCFAGLSAGLGLLTKGTAYVYLAPILLLFAIVLLRSAIKYKDYTYITHGFISLLLLISVNVAGYTRNYRFCKNILGLDKKEAKTYSNDRMSLGLLLSAIVKNSSLHLSIDHTGAAAEVVDTAVYKLHSLLGVSLKDSTINYGNMPFTSRAAPTSEDTAPNPLHFILLLASMIVLLVALIKNRLPAAVILLYVTILLEILFFCGYLKWQTWHSRLQVPLFMLSVPLICYAISIKTLYKRLFYIIVPVLLLYALAVVCFNNIRPFKTTTRLTTNVSVFTPRYQKYFAAKPHVYNDYKVVTDKMKQLKLHNIGLITGGDDWVYPLFTHCFSSPFKPVYIQVNNSTKTTGRPEYIDVIVSFKPDAPYIDHGNKRYYKQTKTTFLALYK